MVCLGLLPEGQRVFPVYPVYPVYPVFPVFPVFPVYSVYPVCSDSAILTGEDFDVLEFWDWIGREVPDKLMIQ